jgi:hypothetical protein
MKPCPFKHAHPEYTPDNEETRLGLLARIYGFGFIAPFVILLGHKEIRKMKLLRGGTIDRD